MYAGIEDISSLLVSTQSVAWACRYSGVVGFADDLSWFAADRARRHQAGRDGGLDTAGVEAVHRPVAGNAQVGEPTRFGRQAVLRRPLVRHHVALRRID